MSAAEDRAAVVAEGLTQAKRLAALLNEIEDTTPYVVYTRAGSIVLDGATQYVLTDHYTGTWRVNGLRVLR